MSNNWRTDTLSMVQLIQYDTDNNTRYYPMVAKDGAQNHPIQEKDGVLHWEECDGLALILKMEIIDKKVLLSQAIEHPDDDAIKDLTRKIGWSLPHYQQIFHNSEDQEDE